LSVTIELRDEKPVIGLTSVDFLGQLSYLTVPADG
jgi:hypothetical protein